MSNAERLRGAVVGCGMIADYHLRGWRRIPEVELVALCDVDAAAAESRRAAFAPAARLYRELDALLTGERLDFVDLVTPPALHAAHVRAARTAGLHVLCQKPLCPELAEARALVAEGTAAGKLFLVHENHRFRPWFAEVLRRHEEGFFGRISYARFEQLDPYAPAEPFKRTAPRGLMLEYGTHLVDMMRALLGEPSRVFARFGRPNPEVAAESLAHAVYDCGAATAVIDIAWKAGGVQQGTALVVGDRGEAFYEGRMTRGESARLRFTRGGETVLEEQRRPTDDYVESFYLFQRAATDAMLGRAPAPQPARDNLRTLAATFAAYDAAGAERAVSIDVPLAL